MDRPNFSIIIPAYNSQQTIQRAIQSVIDQTAKDWELIIIDDGSTDDSSKKVKPFLQDERVSYYYQANLGPSGARNKGIEKSRGEYLIFLDADDEFLPGLIEKLHEIDYNKYDLIFWYTKKIFGKKTSVWMPKKLEKIYNYLKASFLSGSLCCRKKILIDAGGYDENLNFGENYELGIRISQIPLLRLEYLKEVYHQYHPNAGNPHRNNPQLKIKSLNYLLNKHLTIYQRDKYSYSRLLYQIGLLNQQAGNREEALICYKKAIDINQYYWKPYIRNYFLKLEKLGNKI